MKILSKRYKEALSKIEKGKVYDKEEALNLLKETSTTKFDSTVEVSVRLNLDTKKADQQLRGALVLPKGTGKTKRTLVICNTAKLEEAKASGSDFYGDKEMIEKIEKEMMKIFKEGYSVDRKEVDRDFALKYFAEKGQDYKIDLIEGFDKERIARLQLYLYIE